MRKRRERRIALLLTGALLIAGIRGIAAEEQGENTRVTQAVRSETVQPQTDAKTAAQEKTADQKTADAQEKAGDQKQTAAAQEKTVDQKQTAAAQEKTADQKQTAPQEKEGDQKQAAAQEKTDDQGGANGQEDVKNPESGKAPEKTAADETTQTETAAGESAQKEAAMSEGAQKETTAEEDAERETAAEEGAQTETTTEKIGQEDTDTAPEEGAQAEGAEPLQTPEDGTDAPSAETVVPGETGEDTQKTLADNPPDDSALPEPEELPFVEDPDNAPLSPQNLRLRVSLRWEDENNAAGQRPEAVKVYLYRLTAMDLGSGTAQPNPKAGCVGYVILNAGNTWSAAVDTQAFLDDSFYWQEEIPAGYAIYQETNEDTTVTSITNSYTGTVGNEARRTLTILWDDEEDKLGLRPAQLAAQTNSGNGTVLSAQSGWTATLTGLPVYDDDTRLDHMWQEIVVENYVLTAILIDGEDTVFTYTCQMEEAELVFRKVKLTVKYLRNGVRAAEDYVGIYEAGDAYNVKSPALAGYDVDRKRVKGTILADTTITVNYTPQQHTLTVRYRYFNGAEAAGTYQTTLLTGESYAVGSPGVSGYSPDNGQISGSMQGRDLEYVVYYYPLPAPEPETEVTIDEYETPLGLGTVTVNAGECFE